MFSFLQSAQHSGATLQPEDQVNNNRTVSDTKRTFYTLHTRPINSIYRRVVEELMVEMHLLSVNVDFRYDPVYALGVVTAFERFMQGYSPETDKTSIFNALCQAQGDDPQRYRQDAQRLEALAARLSVPDLIAWIDASASFDDVQDLQEAIRAIATNPQFKYSRLFTIGLFALLEKADADLVKDQEARTNAFAKLCTALKLPEEKVAKDLDLYRSNLEKIAQARSAIEDILRADRKKREQQTAKASISSSGSSPEGSV